MSPADLTLSILTIILMFGGMTCQGIRAMKGDSTSKDATRAARLNWSAITLLLAASATAIFASDYGIALICFVFATGSTTQTMELRAKARRLAIIEREQQQAELERGLAQTDKTLGELGLPLTPRIPVASPEPDCQEGCELHHVHHADPIRKRRTEAGGGS